MSGNQGLKKRITDHVPEWANPPSWINHPKPCRSCDAPIRILRSQGTAEERPRAHVVDAEPSTLGWVRVWLTDRRITFQREKVGTVPGQPYISFRRHRCPNWQPPVRETSEMSTGT